MKDIVLAQEPIQLDAAHSIRLKNAKVTQAFCGTLDANLSILSEEFDLKMQRCGRKVDVFGSTPNVQKAIPHLKRLVQMVESGTPICQASITGLSEEAGGSAECLYLPSSELRPRSEHQKQWLKALLHEELSIGTGPAGTGKTMLAVGAGLQLFLSGAVERMIFTRPAVEAGERLGFLPGDMKEKVDPYMQPIYDALHQFLPGRQVSQLIGDRKIEIAPLAFMRGRTLARAFVLLDEAQNTTAMQMKMFLTRLGRGSRMAITGDPRQVDLPKGVSSGLTEATRVLAGVPGIAQVEFSASDVVRHPLVARIVDAYEAHEAREASL